MQPEITGEIPTENNSGVETQDIVDDPYYNSDGTYESAVRGTNIVGKPISETKGQEFLFPTPKNNEPEINKPPENLIGRNSNFRQGITVFNGMAANLQRARQGVEEGSNPRALRASAIAVNAFLVNTIRDFGVNSQYVTNKEDFHQFFEFFGGASVTDLVQSQGFKFSNIQKEMAIDSLRTYYFDSLINSLKSQAQEVIPLARQDVREVDLNDTTPTVRFSREDLRLVYDNGQVSFESIDDPRNPEFANSQSAYLNENYSETLSTILRAFANITNESFDDTWEVYGASLVGGTGFGKAAVRGQKRFTANKGAK